MLHKDEVFAHLCKLMFSGDDQREASVEDIIDDDLPMSILNGELQNPIFITSEA